MKKAVLIAFIMHVFILTVVWVGFPVPNNKKNTAFFYGQLLMPATTDIFSTQRMVPVKAETLSDDSLWYKARAMDKPRR